VDERVTIRDAAAGEEAEVVAVVRAAYREFRHLFPPGAIEQLEKDVAVLAGGTPHTDLILAECDGSLAGAVWYYPDGSGYHERWPVGWAAFRLLSVLPSARGLGIGRALVEECVRRARASGCAAIGMHTVAFMEDARRLYQRLGFPVVAELGATYAGLEVIGYLKELHPGASALLRGGGLPGGGGAGHGE
jgi:GNAT superfamily N-acetyltransferase